MKYTPSQKVIELYRALLALKNKNECNAFLRDLLTHEELEEFGNRWLVAHMLANKKTYTEIEKQTGMSSTTIARISKWLEHGANGYKLMIKRQYEK